MKKPVIPVLGQNLRICARKLQYRIAQLCLTNPHLALATTDRSLLVVVCGDDASLLFLPYDHRDIERRWRSLGFIANVKITNLRSF